MKAHRLIADSLSDWREVQNASDLAHQTFDQLDDTEVARLAMRAYTDEIRAALRRKVDGVPVYANVEGVDPGTGKTTRQYKQTEAFSVDDYRAAVKSYTLRAQSEYRVAEALRADCAARHGVQLTLREATA